MTCMLNSVVKMKMFSSWLCVGCVCMHEYSWTCMGVRTCGYVVLHMCVDMWVCGIAYVCVCVCICDILIPYVCGHVHM